MINGMSYNDPRFQDNPARCQRCGGGTFVVVREPGCTNKYCSLCAEIHTRHFDPIDRRCDKCKIIKKMERGQVRCEECRANDRQDAAAWNAFMGREPR